MIAPVTRGLNLILDPALLPRHFLLNLSVNLA